jgi:type II secretory pathway pseudopilin PulG
MKKQKLGFTLIEVLLVVGFVATGTLAVLIVSNIADRYGKAATETANIHALAEAVWKGPGIMGFYPVVSNAGMNNSNFTPETMRDPSNASSIVNGFGSDINVTPATYVNSYGITYNGFNIATTNIPFNYCSKIVSDAGGDFDQISVQGTIVKAVTASDVDPATMAVACSSATNVTITFTSFQ